MLQGGQERRSILSQLKGRDPEEGGLLYSQGHRKVWFRVGEARTK